MIEIANDTTALVELVPATVADGSTLDNLLQLYAHDFSEFHPVEINDEGRFSYRQLPLYFTEADRHPFLIKVDGRPGGFVFVKKGSEISGNTAAWDMAEFFILRAHRRRGLGTRFALQVWERFPGAWEVRVMESNQSALKFWAAAIEKYAGRPVSPVVFAKAGEDWHLFRFESKFTEEIL